MNKPQEVDFWSLREKARESWEYAISNVLVYLGKFPDADDQAVNFAAEEYIRGRWWCELHLCLDGDGHSHYVCIIETANMRLDAFRNLEVERGALSRNDPMFVNIAQLIELPEKVVFVRWPSVVRLKRLDFISGSRRDITDDLRKPSHVFRGIFTDNRELSSVKWPVLSGQRKLPSNMVEGRPELEYGIACNYGEMGVNHRNLNSHDIESMLGIFLCGNAKGFCINELAQFHVENIEVFFRPFDPQSRILEARGHVLYSGYEEQENTEDFPGPRNSRANKGSRVQGSGESGGADPIAQAINSPPPPGQVASQAEHGHPLDGYTAKHIHSGSLEDAWRTPNGIRRRFPAS
ncbi:MAG: hypothetical protein HW388_893 [Dehalococcoidia bacterium]|nr:hypothetical protein [Dehalococcoidia bacterium]